MVKNKAGREELRENLHKRGEWATVWQVKVKLLDELSQKLYIDAEKHGGLDGTRGNPVGQRPRGRAAVPHHYTLEFPLKDINVIETEVVSVLEYWLRKIEQEAAKLFKQKPGNKTENKGEPKNEIRTFPSLGQDLAAARSKPESWENFEDRRPPRNTVHESRTKLTSSSSQDLEDRTRIQFIRWSNTRVYRVTSEMRRDAMQERLDKVRNSVSRVMFQADGVQSETDIRNKDSQ